jgi:EmrB/QacA subfamily drug resistance transporter
LLLFISDQYFVLLVLRANFGWFQTRTTIYKGRCRMQQNKILVLVGVFLAIFLSALDQTIVATAAPQIVNDLLGMSLFSWIFVAYMLASTIAVPIYGKLSDLYGRRGLFVMGISIFLFGSILCGYAASMMQLIIFRALQGLGAGAMMVNALAIIGDVFPPAERGKWQGLIGGVFGLASITGPFLGGWITDQLSWRWIFFVNIPVGILAIFISWRSMPRVRRQTKASIDFVGAMLFVVGIIPLLLVFIFGGSQYPWLSYEICLLMGIALVALALFVMVELRAVDPMISFSLFKNRVFAMAIGSTFFVQMGMFGAVLYVPIFAQSVIGITATSSGIILMPLMMASVLASAISGQIISRTGKYKTLAIVGVTLFALGNLSFSFIGLSTTQFGLVLRMIFLGLGMGVTMPLFPIVIQNAFGKSKLGQVTATMQLFRHIGATVGTAILGGVMNSQLAARLSLLSTDPFVLAAKHLGAGGSLEHITGNTIRNLLSPEGLHQMEACIAQAPGDMQERLHTCFSQFVITLKSAFSSSVGILFFVCMLFMVGALCFLFFLPEVSLRQHEQSVLEQAGKELEAHLGQSDKHNEPLL